jgi:cyclic pyranopterin phosphate synthase
MFHLVQRMVDSIGRNIEYLRLSLTEQCNLSCLYCRGGARPAPGRESGEDEIQPDEIMRIVRCMASLGISKVRLTGGEPLLRRDLEKIVAALGGCGLIKDLCMTTNAQGIAPRVKALRDAGLMRLNISLDSLKPDRFQRITGGGNLREALDGVEAALAWGLTPVKVNCVVLRGINSDEIDDFISLAKKYPVQVRFIELMPLGEIFHRNLMISSREILNVHEELRPLEPSYTAQPAENYTGDGFRGTVGFISPISRRFCDLCNRVRVTSDGRLRPCLGDNFEINLRDAMRDGDEALYRAVRRGVFNKSRGHAFTGGFVTARSMNRIGG